MAASHARRPSAASPSRKAGSGTSPGDAGTVRVIAVSHRSVTGSGTRREHGQEKIRRARDGSHPGHGHGNGGGYGNGHGDGNGNGPGGNGNAQVLSIST